ncbi:NUDIX domain-containing protein [Ilumatobacter sp.]|uniref:NUDIX domain-containing protein n=1 Tax=Ilumatobacter sp. TaxID=1967498 RepID=UPI003B526E59
MFERRSGDGFLRCGDGHVRWGIFGAAGVVFVVHEDGAPRVMLQKRSAMAHEGGTWSCAGGALDQGEMPLEGALREASEEIGAVPASARVVGEYVFRPSPDWAYTTVVVEVAERFGASMNFETDAVGWFTLDEVDGLAIHAGFAAAWPHLRRIVGAGVATDPGEGAGGAHA